MKPNHLIDPDALIASGAIFTHKIGFDGSITIDRFGVSMKLPTKGLDIGRAVTALEAGQRVRRAGWNGKGMHLELQVPDAHSKMTLPYVFMLTAQGDRVPWLCSQTDLLAKDWEIAEADEAPVEPDLIVTGPITAYAHECVSEANWELAK